MNHKQKNAIIRIVIELQCFFLQWKNNTKRCVVEVNDIKICEKINNNKNKHFKVSFVELIYFLVFI